MSASKTSRNPMDEPMIDKLVDGELDELQRCELLTSFDTRPDGWRRCALAFLEAQSWRQGLASFVTETAEQPAAATRPQPPPARAVRSARRKLGGQVVTAMAMAASFLLALWLSWATQDAFRLNRAQAPSPEQVAKALPTPTQVGAVASAPITDTAQSEVSPTSGLQQRAVSPGIPWQIVTLSANGPNGDPVGAIQIPACERELVDSHWLDSLPSALPPEVQESLERSGYRVRRHRELLPIDMQNGHRLVVPVEEVEVRYVGQPPL